MTLGQEAAEAFPELSLTLSQMATMLERTMLGEFYNLVSVAQEEMNRNPEDFRTYVSLIFWKVHGNRRMLRKKWKNTFPTREAGSCKI